MQTLNKVLIFGVFLITTACSANNIDIEGYWYGSYDNNGEISPLLFHFENGMLSDCFSTPTDTVAYKVKGNKVQTLSDDPYNLLSRFIIEINDQKLDFYFDSKSNYAFTLRKSESESFVYDYIINKKLKIELPLAAQKGGIKYDEFKLYNPIYFGTIENELVVHLYDTTVVFNDSFYKTLCTNKKLLHNLQNGSLDVCLLADKAISLKEINSLLKQLNALNLGGVFCITAPESYAEINYYLIDLLTISEKEEVLYNSFKEGLVTEHATDDDLEEMMAGSDMFPSMPPPPPPEPDLEWFVEEGLFLVERTSSGIKLNNKLCTNDEFRLKLKEEIQSNSYLEIPYYVSDSVTYQEYISVVDLIAGVYAELRNDYLFESYGVYYDELNANSMKRREVERKFHMTLWRLDASEYRKFINAL